MYSFPRTAAVVPNEAEAVRWIEGIRFIQNGLHNKPVVLVERYNQIWRNFVSRMAKERNCFEYIEYADEDELRIRVQQLASNPSNALWILLSSKEEY